jgi:hypothetical protein
MATSATIDPPAGFVLDSTAAPPPPDGFVLDGSKAITPEFSQRLQAQMRADEAGKRMSEGDKDMLTAAVNKWVQDPKGAAVDTAKLAGGIVGLPFAVWNAAVEAAGPSTVAERRAWAKSHPIAEAIEATGEAGMKLVPFVAGGEAMAGGKALGKALAIPFAASAAASVPGAASRFGAAMGDPNATTGEKIMSGADLGANVVLPAIGGVAAKRMMEPPPVTPPAPMQGPMAQGSVLQMPAGARPPEQVKNPKPEVPSTPPEPERSMTATEEIRQRGLRTKAQIQQAFPHLTREQAAAFRDQAWGGQPAEVTKVTVPPEIAKTITEAAPLLPKSAEAAAKAVSEPLAKDPENATAPADAFKALQARMSALDPSSPTFEKDFEEVSGEMEKIKNANKGYVPGTEARVKEDEAAAEKAFHEAEAAKKFGPALAPGEKGTGELFKGEDQPFNLAGQKTSDGDRVASEKAAQEQRAKEAADMAAKQQPGLPGTQPKQTFGTWPKEEWDYGALKKQTSKERRDKARFLGLRDDKGDLIDAPKALADVAQRRVQEEQQQLAGEPARNPTPPTEMAPSSQVGPSRRAIEGMKSSARISDVVPPQEGVDPSQVSKHGQDLIEAGADPEQVMQQVEKTKRANDDDIAVIRRRQENLAKVSDATAEAYLKDRFAKNAPELKAKATAAREAEKAWTQRIQKSAAPIFARLGHSFQGATDINTDSWIGLQRAYGKEFTPKQLAEAQAHAEANKAAQERIAALEKQLADLTEKMPGEKAPPGTDSEAIKKVFADYQPGKPMTDLQAKTLWNYLRSKYADKFGLQLHKIAAQIATDLGLTHDDVLKGLGKPAGVKKLADAILVAARERRRLKADAENWVENQKTPGWTRFVKSIPQKTFNLAIFGHGGTWIGTHTPAHVFNPGDWATLFPAWFRSLKTYYKTGIANDRGLYHEQLMQRMTSDPLYPTMRAGGLKIAPEDRSDAYQNKRMDNFFGRIGLAGNEAFDGLKLFRAAKFKGEWDQLPESLKTKEMAAALADGINTSTGASNVQMPKALSTIAFAPRLEYSRWKLLFGDTYRSSKTFSDWKNATPEEKQSAMRDFRQKATVVGTYFGLLALNQGILSAANSKQSVNFTDSKRGDWLEFKAAGLNVGIGTPFLHIFGLLRNLTQDAFGQPKGKLAALDSREKNIAGDVFTYGRQKLSPIGQRVADVVTQRDIMQNVVPWSNDQLKKYEIREGKHKLGIGEYAAESFTPIFMAQSAREIWKDQGATTDQADRIWRAIITGGAGGLTGARVGEQVPYYNRAPADK